MNIRERVEMYDLKIRQYLHDNSYRNSGSAESLEDRITLSELGFRKAEMNNLWWDLCELTGVELMPPPDTSEFITVGDVVDTMMSRLETTH